MPTLPIAADRDEAEANFAKMTEASRLSPSTRTGPFYRIETPAYEDRPANSLLVNGDASRDLHVAQITNAGCPEVKVTELTAAEYIRAALAQLRGAS